MFVTLAATIRTCRVVQLGYCKQSGINAVGAKAAAGSIMAVSALVGAEGASVREHTAKHFNRSDMPTAHTPKKICCQEACYLVGCFVRQQQGRLLPNGGRITADVHNTRACAQQHCRTGDSRASSGSRQPSCTQAPTHTCQPKRHKRLCSRCCPQTQGACMGPTVLAPQGEAEGPQVGACMQYSSATHACRRLFESCPSGPLNQPPRTPCPNVTLLPAAPSAPRGPRRGQQARRTQARQRPFAQGGSGVQAQGARKFLSRTAVGHKGWNPPTSHSMHTSSEHTMAQCGQTSPGSAFGSSAALY